VVTEDLAVEADARQREFAVEVVRQLRAAGYEALWAGGCVRDQLLGRMPKDYDVATSARPEEIRRVFGNQRTIPVGAAFGVITVLGRKSARPIEVAAFRTDGEYLDGRHPASVAYSDAQHDALRRDFTINGIFFDPLDRQVVDYVDGQRDLAARLVRAIGDPAARFAEDRLRMLRAVRFAAAYDFEIEPQTFAAIVRHAEAVAQVSAERVGAELAKMLEHPSRSHSLELLRQAGLLPVVLPELQQLLATDDSAWAALLHRGARLGPARLPVALAAAAAGLTPATVRAMARRLRWTNRDGEEGAWLVGRLPDLAAACDLAWPRLQRILVHPLGPELVALGTAIRGAADPSVARAVAALQLPPDRLNPPPLVTGDALVAAGIPPGPRLGRLLERLRDLQLEGRLRGPEEALEVALNDAEDSG